MPDTPLLVALHSAYAWLLAAAQEASTAQAKELRTMAARVLAMGGGK